VVVAVLAATEAHKKMAVLAVQAAEEQELVLELEVQERLVKDLLVEIQHLLGAEAVAVGVKQEIQMALDLAVTGFNLQLQAQPFSMLGEVLAVRTMAAQDSKADRAVAQA
jgi:hypothetical protein